MLTPFARPLFVMVKPVGARCNLRCDYCYYLEKQNLYKDTQKLELDYRLLDSFIHQYIEAQTQREVLFIWHGGEPLLRGKAFYRQALALQRKYGRGRQIDNCIQTNGTLIDDEWCKFFKENNFLVGISIDGDQEFHNAHRGQSFQKVLQGISLLNKHNVEWNAMAVVNSTNVKDPLRFYRFFKNIGCRFIQFEPIVETVKNNPPTLTKESITAEEWGNFLCQIFDEWAENDVGEYFIQYFESTLANMCDVTPGLCSLAPFCGQSAAMEHNGDLYSCDHFVFPEYKLGNIRRQTITEMMYSERQRNFGRQKYDTLPRQCRECQWLSLCYGECPKNRIATDCYGNPGLNHLCKGFQTFFQHSQQKFLEIKATL